MTPLYQAQKAHEAENDSVGLLNHFVVSLGVLVSSIFGARYVLGK